MSVANTYTGPYGYSTQGQNMQNFVDTLGSISPTMANYASASLGGVNNYPQAISEQDKLLTMFANDQGLAQKYSGTPTTPATPAGQFSSPLMATSQSVTDPTAGGIASPSDIMGQARGGAVQTADVLDAIQSAVNYAGQSSTDFLKTLVSLEAQYGYSPTSTSTLSNDVLKSGSKTDQAQYLRDLYTSTNSPVMQRRIEAQAKALNIKLSPTELNQNELSYVDNSATLLSTINDALASLDNAPDSGTGPIAGQLTQQLVSNPLTSGLITGDLGNLGRQLTKLQGMSDRKIMGGRLISDLVRRFGGSFPGLNYSKDQIRKYLTDLQNQALNTVNAEAINNGYYGGANELLGTYGYDQAIPSTNQTQSPSGTQFEGWTVTPQ